MVAHLWDLVWRSPFNPSVVTIESDDEGWVSALEHKFDRLNVPYTGMMGFEHVDALARHLVFMPNAMRVYHGREEWSMKFGRAGEYVSDANVFRVV